MKRFLYCHMARLNVPFSSGAHVMKAILNFAFSLLLSWEVHTLIMWELKLHIPSFLESDPCTCYVGTKTSHSLSLNQLHHVWFSKNFYQPL
jgi:hypothetical protein